MAGSDMQDTSPLVMQNIRNRESESLPEVVPVENLKDNTIRHEDAWFLQRSPFSPLSPANSHNTPPASVSEPYSRATDRATRHSEAEETIGVLGFHKTPRKKFAMLVALSVFLFTALALSTGLGIPLAKCRNRSDPHNYAPISPLKVVSVKKNGYCGNNGETQHQGPVKTRDGNFLFDLYCAKIFAEGLTAYASGVRNGGDVRNILAVVAYSFTDCVEACASMNREAKAGSSPNPPCQSVTFYAGMSDLVMEHGGNCFVKNATLNNLNEAPTDNTAISAEVHRLRQD